MHPEPPQLGNRVIPAFPVGRTDHPDATSELDRHRSSYPVGRTGRLRGENRRELAVIPWGEPAKLLIRIN